MENMKNHPLVVALSIVLGCTVVFGVAISWNKRQQYKYEDVSLQVKALTQEEIELFTKEGIAHIPVGTMRSSYPDSDEIANIFIPEEDNLGYFSWGPFELDRFSLYQADSQSIMPKGIIGAATLPEIFEIDGQSCLTEGLVFDRKAEALESSLHFEDYELFTCSVKNQIIDTPQGKWQIAKNEPMRMLHGNASSPLEPMLSGKLASFEYSVESMSQDKSDVSLRLLNYPELDDTIQIQSLYTDSALNLLEMKAEISLPEGKGFKIGQCDYTDFIGVRLANFTSKTLELHVVNYPEEGQGLSDKCTKHVMPYQLVK